jgi:type IV pilus assembly protein PilQ
MVADGDTIFLGGLRSEEKGSAKDYIPLLGELPIIGKLFTYDVAQNENRHLIVSLRVNVIGKRS